MGGQELGGCEVAEGLVWADVVVVVFETTKGILEASDSGSGIGDVGELVAIGAVGALDPPVTLGAVGRQVLRCIVRPLMVTLSHQKDEFLRL